MFFKSERWSYGTHSDALCNPHADQPQLFSALYKLLPEAQGSLAKGGYGPRPAAWILIACFLAGVWGIQLLSRVMHLFMHTEVVDCDHSHDEDGEHHKSRHASHSHENGFGGLERTPLLSRPTDLEDPPTRHGSAPEMQDIRAPAPLEMGTFQRPSLPSRLTRKMTALVSGEKDACDHEGPCKGYTNPCGAECFRNINARGGTRVYSTISRANSRRPTLRHAASTTFNSTADPTKTLKHIDDTHDIDPKDTRRLSDRPAAPRTTTLPTADPPSPSPSNRSSTTNPNPATDPEAPHHHHVPRNAFLSLSFQTSVAIVLHKLPEGFITYASNHANPDLGFNVFMALAIHNITEGFALALPIYLATSSRLKALLYSFCLGGFSQPLGAGFAAVWLHIAERGKGDYAPSDGIYGGLFAATAGILANVALNLLSQSFELSHSKGLCMFFTFVGMGVLGVSSALTA